MSIATRLLIALSRSEPQSSGPTLARTASSADALDLLHRVCPDLDNLVRGKRLVDYGCGTGHQAIALVSKHHCEVFGLDTNASTLSMARGNAQRSGVNAARLRFVARIPDEERGTFDLVISKDSFEHFADPDQALDEMCDLLHARGRLLITFGPPWFSPYGSHMRFLSSLPWLNLLFSERTIMTVRARYKDDGARYFHEVESGLNKMSVTRFERILANRSLTVVRRRYECVKGLGFLGWLPILRELFINQVTVVVEKK